MRDPDNINTIINDYARSVRLETNPQIDQLHARVRDVLANFGLSISPAEARTAVGIIGLWQRLNEVSRTALLSYLGTLVKEEDR